LLPVRVETPVLADQLQTAGTGERFHEAELWRLRAEAIPRQGGSAAETVAALERALASARQGNAKSLELRAAIALARAREGRAELAGVHEWFGEGHETRDLRAAAALLNSGT